MAGDWIKLEHATIDKPEIISMASRLDIDQDAVVGKCLRLWVWADMQTVNGHALTVTQSFIDRLTHCLGFADALRHVGWLEGRDGLLAVPNFDRHNGQPAKTRAMGNKRKQDERAKSRQCHAASVTETRPEKRREEKRESISTRLAESDLDGLVSAAIDSPDLRKIFIRWVGVREKEHGSRLDEIQAQTILQKLARFGPAGAIESLENAIVGGWKSPRPPDVKGAKGNAGNNSAQQRENSNASALEAAKRSLAAGRGGA